MAIIHATEENFNDEINSESNVLVEFGADWCAPCKMQVPILENFSKDRKVKILQVDVDNSPELANKFKITGVPTIIVFKDGREFIRKTGLTKLDDLKKFI